MNQNTHDPIEGIVQLREELGRVSVSQSFAERVRERVADELEPLRAELADLDVSPEFVVRVRERVDEARRPLWGFNWRWAMPAAGLAVALVAVVLWPRTISELPAPPKTVAMGVTPVVEPPVAPPVVTSSTAQVASPVARRVEAGSSDPASAKPSPRDPFLQVITDQPQILRRLSAMVQGDGAIATESEVVGTSVDLTKDIEIRPIEVSPVVVKWFVEPPPSPGVWPFILRVTADMAERSSK